MNLSDILIDATCELFQTMLMIDVHPVPPTEHILKTSGGSVSGVVGLSGNERGLVAVHAPLKVATYLTTQLLGMEVDEINEDVRDAIGEMANILAGSVKSALNGEGMDVKLSIPSVVSGEDYTFSSRDDCPSAVVPFTMEAGTFMVELKFETN